MGYYRNPTIIQRNSNIPVSHIHGVRLGGVAWNVYSEKEDGGGTKKAENLSNMIYDKVLETTKSSSTERAQFLFTPKGLDITDDCT